ncbi:unnamed protein product [Lepeophtheirus salmonis]|uniref:(salmon louse) hypothetical protein n=1 Tax=Lepeophtheirus salmonis TaxID=72036 RepID=A0A7R8D2F3_LEPSM|nr:unnamed protein product [Lepeophtheirus salmonis]CAF3001010.1 unnamed protein product [Lepeophtheirus salmonis]
MRQLIGFLSLFMLGYSHSQGQEKCPRPDEIAPCQCRTRGPSIQVRNAFAGIEDFITELYIKEPNLKNFPLESVDYLHKLEVFSIENSKIIDIPRIAGWPPESLHSLALANFSDNAISWIHPRAFSYSHYLTEINLKGNAISDAGIIGRAMGYVQSLEHLDISHNLLTEVKQGKFFSNPSIEIHRFELQYRNRIERFMSDAFVDSSNIEKLFLNRNKIQSLSDINFLMDTLPRLRYLELSENEIRDIPFGVFRSYPKLERLFLSGNQISQISTEGLADMPSLRLDISNNGITLIDKDAFKGVSNLDYLNVSYNNIKELDPSMFSNLKELYELDMSFNELTFLSSNLLASQNKLEYISLSNNQLQNLPSSLLSLDNRVKHLDLTSNFVRKFPDDLINKLKNLKKLLFIRNSLDKLTSQSFLKLTSLESIQLHDNRIEIIDNDTFQHLHSLKHLDLSLNIISTVGVALNPLSNLIKLNLSDNYITVLPQKTFTSLKRLSTLDVSNNTIREISEAFKDMPALKYLDLSYNHYP